MATAFAASSFLPSAFASRHRHLSRPGPRRAAVAGLAIRCETSEKQKRQPLEALVPREERFMFEGDELCGPVRHPPIFPRFMFTPKFNLECV
jgi:large subunit ribosomal protein L13